MKKAIVAGQCVCVEINHVRSLKLANNKYGGLEDSVHHKEMLMENVKNY